MRIVYHKDVMVMDNYKAWKINVDDFYILKPGVEQLRFLIKFAVLAPSSHNSQPWKFFVRNDSVEIQPDFTRALPKSDTNHRQLFISLGCALENLLIAADYFGFRTSVKYFFGASNGTTIFVRLAGGDARAGVRDARHLIFSIPRRNTNRSKYHGDPPEESFVAYMKNCAEFDMRVDVISKKQKRDAIAAVVVDAGITAMEDSGFREELSLYVKSNITGAYAGMPGHTLGIPAPLSFLLSPLLKRFNMNKAGKKQDLALLQSHTPAFVIISTRDDDARSWIRTGQRYERIALEAERRDIRTAPMAAVIQIGEFYKNLQNILGTQFRPQMFFRVGYSGRNMPHSPRFLAENVIVS